MSSVFYSIFLLLNLNVLTEATYSSAFGDQQPEAEFCDWLVRRCPPLTSQYRTIDNPLEPTNVSITFYSRRFLGIDDVRQAFKIQGIFYIMWPLPRCAMFTEEMALAENVSAMAAKTQVCRFPSYTTWTPVVYMTNILDASFNIINENLDFVSISNVFGGYAWAQSAGTFDITADLDFSVIFHLIFLIAD